MSPPEKLPAKDAEHEAKVRVRQAFVRETLRALRVHRIKPKSGGLPADADAQAEAVATRAEQSVNVALELFLRRLALPETTVENRPLSADFSPEAVKRIRRSLNVESIRIVTRHKRDLDSEIVKRRLKQAIDSGDWTAFDRVRKAAGMAVEKPLSQIGKLKLFLLSHWAEKRNGVGPLYPLTWPQVFDACRKGLDQANLTPDAVKQTARRLKLR